jgi:hypothetical protein
VQGQTVSALFTGAAGMNFSVGIVHAYPSISPQATTNGHHLTAAFLPVLPAGFSDCSGRCRHVRRRQSRALHRSSKAFERRPDCHNKQQRALFCQDRDG